MFFLSLKELWMCVCVRGVPHKLEFFFRFLVGQCMESEFFGGSLAF